MSDGLPALSGDVAVPYGCHVVFQDSTAPFGSAAEAKTETVGALFHVTQDIGMCIMAVGHYCWNDSSLIACS